MKDAKRYLKKILGSFIIGATINLFFRNYKIVPSSLFGFDLIYSIKMGMNLALAALLINIMFVLIGYLSLPRKQIRRVVLPALLIPLFIFITTDIDKIIDISSADMLLIAIFGGVLIGFGSSLIYKEDGLVSGADVLELISKEIIGPNGIVTNFILDFFVIIFTAINFGIEKSLYSLVAIVIIEMMRVRSTLGISEEKVFYIITKEEDKVRKYIMEKLHYDLTIFDVKGGYTQTKNKIIMTAIPTKDYYKLREGIKAIDPNAFISITDSYEVYNDNISINKK